MIPPLKDMVQPLKSKWWPRTWKRDSVIKPMDHSRVLRDGHICFTAFSKIIIPPPTILSWITEFKMPPSFQERITTLSRKTADLNRCRNLYQTSFSFHLDLWIPISRTTARRSSLILMWPWSRILKSCQRDQWFSSWSQWPPARTSSNQMVHRTWVPL